ncbi:MAG TPA: hypothetical protein VJ694_02400 [Patescibacteria group bacterium]|nr:hypothetical protein [Patescibacteria group bacterium]
MARTTRTREKRRAHRLAWRLVDFMQRNFQWRVRFMPLQRDVRARVSIGFEPHEIMVGATIPDRHLIALDPAFEDLFAVLIHECLHAMLPAATEEKVLRLERLVRRHLTVRQARAFIFLLNVRLL